jgi:hypothetical protein
MDAEVMAIPEMALVHRIVLGCVGLARIKISRGKVRRQSPAFLTLENGMVR